MKNTTYNYVLFLTANFLNRLSQVQASYDAIYDTIMDAVGKVEAVSKLHDHTFECTGVLVGPCLMLTSQFCIADPINYEAYGDYVRFMPGYAMGYSQGAGIGTYYWWDSRAPTASPIETDSQRAFDYAVVELDTCLGETNGHMCVKSFDPSWVGLKVWQSITYWGENQVFTGLESPFTILGFNEFTNSDGTISYIMYSDLPADLLGFSDQVGHPVFGWWDDEPCVIGLGNGYHWIDDYGNKYKAFIGGPGLEDLVRDHM